MWHNHPFSQRNKTSKIAVEAKVGGNGKEGLNKILKRWVRQYRGVFITWGVLRILCQLWPKKNCSGKRIFWYSRKNPWKDLWRSSFLIKLQDRSLLLFKKWAQSQLFLKNFAWNFQNRIFTEYIWVAVSWNYILTSVLQRYPKILIYIWTCFYYVRH